MAVQRADEARPKGRASMTLAIIAATIGAMALFARITD